MAEEDVYFLFHGNNDNVNNTITSINRASLALKPDSVLAVLAKQEWNKDPSTGTAEVNPIHVRPLDSCGDYWEPLIAPLIKIRYESSSLSSPPPKVQLPANGVELEDVVEVFQFYGILLNSSEDNGNDENLASLFDLSMITDPLTLLRANIYLNKRKVLNTAYQKIWDMRKKCHRPELHLLFLHHRHDEEFIHENNTDHGKYYMDVFDCDIFHFLEDDQFRNSLQGMLQDDGFICEFSHLYFNVHGPPRDTQTSPRGIDSCRIRCLKITVPEARKRARLE